MRPNELRGEGWGYNAGASSQQGPAPSGKFSESDFRSLSRSLPSQPFSHGLSDSMQDAFIPSLRSQSFEALAADSPPLSEGSLSIPSVGLDRIFDHHHHQLNHQRAEGKFPMKKKRSGHSR